MVQRHPADFIQLKIDVFDWLLETQDKRIGKSPAGYLVKSINDDYAAPKGFISKAERQQQQEARQAKERLAAEGRRRQHEQDAREKAERQAIDDYWESLTPEQQAELDVASTDQADPATLAMETGPLKSMGQTLRRHAYIRQLLRDRPAAEG
jgi:tyrosyl-tRNA synthetase